VREVSVAWIFFRLAREAVLFRPFVDAQNARLKKCRDGDTLWL